jgi:N-methylhydantoinase A
MGYRISVDTGGTFTDVVVTDGRGGFLLGKALTDRERAFESIRAGLADVAEQNGASVEALLGEADMFIYGTTRATNAIVERKVAKTAFLTTEGFPDILVLKEGGKFEPHRLDMEYPDPYVPRSLTFEVQERVDAEGGIVHALDEAALRRTLADVRAHGVEALAVCLLWSISNPAHELRVGELIAEELPGVPYTLSHQLNPMMREYRRASAAAIDASLKPLMQRYLTDLEGDLREAGYLNDVLVSTSFGGVMHLADVVERPIYLVKSGPAMAPVAGLAYGKAEGLPQDLIVCDAGGTTFDISLIRDGQVEFTRETWLGPQWTGDNLGMASVAVHSIGAGGGSIAWVDSGGLLRVGPRSAGADPGPACYGRGGTEPTVTDAAVVLGYIDPNHFLGGRMPLDAAAAETAIGRIASRLDLTLLRAAFAVLAVANENMIQAIGEITINEGVDPREAALVAGGGAGGLNIVPIARELGCETILMPRTAGALSASGMQFSDIVTEAGASRLTASDDFDFKGVNEALGGIGARLEVFAKRLRDRGIDKTEVQYYVEARYRFQVWELEIAVPSPEIQTDKDVERLVRGFHEMHERVFAVQDPGQAVEFLNWRGRLRGIVQAASLEPGMGTQSGSEGGATPTAFRDVYFGDDAGLCKAAIYRGPELPAGVEFTGPAIIEEPTSTLVVDDATRVFVSRGGRYLLRPKESA